MLERIDPHLYGVFHLVKDVFIPARDRHVITNIRTDLRRTFAVPFIDRVLDAAVFSGQAEIHHHRRAARRRRPCSGFKGFRGGGAHKGHFKMGVRINPPRDHIGPFSIDIFIASKVFANLADDFTFDQNIGFPRAICRTDRAVFNHFAHGSSPLRIFVRTRVMQTDLSRPA